MKAFDMLVLRGLTGLDMHQLDLLFNAPGYVYEGQHVRFLSSRVKGIKIHAGTRVFLPPSWVVVDPGLTYADITARVLDCPAFLLDASETPRETGMVIPFPEEPCRLCA